MQGSPTRFCPDALVSSSFPSSESDAGTQRKRWEHGHMMMILNNVPRLLIAAIRKKNISLLALGLDLMVPPLALQSMLLLVGLMITGMASLFGISSNPFMVLALGCILFLSTILIAWYRFARDIISLKELLSIPSYIFSKLSIYTSFISSRESRWNKTGRGDD
jgi:cellulose synthase/poly-beta-1,6-N-acetylglucosamine synthase-like glycosyltransferase